MDMRTLSQITAILGPTNTGKTWYALNRMQAYDKGMIGFPLRLLARENYDRLVATHGAASVALITGEEKIIPPQARYYCCTVEAMPVSDYFDFVAIDEVQLAGDPDRGHIFTDRILHCRGSKETMFMGSDTIRPMLKRLIKDIIFETRPRLSTLTYTGFKKLTRLPKRTAIIAFSMDDVYAVADLIKKQKGGAAIVMGALSPRTRNAQVDMYQSGEIDYVIATDAIGMGLNMDIRHVAFAATRKYDGKRARNLYTHELAQIAGRAGRHMTDGTFGVTGNIPDLDDMVVEAIENHRFDPLEIMSWRNSQLNFNTPKMLLKSLDTKPDREEFRRGREADDYRALTDMMTRDDVMARATNPAAVQLLWDVCQIPDFRKVLSDDHHEFAARIYDLIMTHGTIRHDWMEERINRLDNDKGDVDTLMNRLAHIRTWTYLTHKQEWIDNAGDWQNHARAIEDKLSDALHQALIKRFVDRRNHIFSDAINGEKDLLAGVKRDGTVIVEGMAIGHLHGLKFRAGDQLLGDKGSHAKKIMNAAIRALRPEINKRVKSMINWNNVGAETGRFTLHEDGQITWQDNKTNPLPGDPVASIQKGQDTLMPSVKLIDSDMIDQSQKAQLQDTITTWVQSHLKDILVPLYYLMDETDTPLEGVAKGIGHQLYENLGVIHRSEIENLIPDLTPELRVGIRKKKIKMGPILVFMPELVKPAAINLRALLWGLWNDRDLPMPRPADGRVSVQIDPKAADRNFLRSIGYPVFGNLCIRIDMLDRVVTDIYDSAKEGKFQAQHKYMEWLGCGEDDLYAVLDSMGFKRQKTDKEPEKTIEDTEKTDNAGKTIEKTEEKKELAVYFVKKGKISDRPKPKPFKKTDKKPHKGKNKPQNTAKTFQAKPKKTEIDDDSPFAILKQLQK